MRLLRTPCLAFLILLSATPSWAGTFDCSRDPLGCFIIWALGTMGMEADRRAEEERQACIVDGKAQGYPQKASEDACSDKNTPVSKDFWGKRNFLPLDQFRENQCRNSLFQAEIYYDSHFYYQKESTFKYVLDASYYCNLKPEEVAQTVVGSILQKSEKLGYFTLEERRAEHAQFHEDIRTNYGLPQRAFEACIAEGNSSTACEAVREQNERSSEYRNSVRRVENALRNCNRLQQYYRRMTITTEGFQWAPPFTEEQKLEAETECQELVDAYLRGDLPELLFDGADY